MNRDASGPSDTQGTAQSATGSEAVDVNNNNALCIGVSAQKWTVSDALAATIVLLTDKYRKHQILSLDDPNCEVGFGYDGPFSYFEGDIEFNNKQTRPDGTQMPTASTTRIAYSYHGKEAIAHILSLNADDPKLINEVWNAVRNDFIKPFDNAIVGGGGRLTEQSLQKAGTSPELDEFIGLMEPFMEANPNDPEHASLVRFMQACYAADGFFTRIVWAIAHRHAPAPQKAQPEDFEVKVPAEAALPESMPVGAALVDDGAVAPARAPTPPPADPNPPARPPIEAGEKKTFKARFPIGTFESIVKDPKNLIYANHRANFSNKENKDQELYRPRACIFDPSLKMWALTDIKSNKICFLDMRQPQPVEADNVTDTFNKPSAISVLEPGQSYAVLDYHGIWEYDARNGGATQRVSFAKKDGKYLSGAAGLAVTADREFATFRQAGLKQKIVLYASNELDKVVGEFDYQFPGAVNSMKPCFLDSCGDRICVSDKGTGGLTVYRYEKYGDTPWLERVVQKDCKLDSDMDILKGQDGKFALIGCAQLDENGQMWICDQKGHSLQWLDANGGFRQRIRFDDHCFYQDCSHFCNCRGFALNIADAQLLACDRKKNVARLYDLSAGTQPVRRSRIG